MFGVNNYIFFKAEDELFMLSILKEEYAINEKMLRAVLNGYNIDMEVPCQKYIQNREISSVMKQMKEDFEKSETKKKIKSTSSASL